MLAEGAKAVMGLDVGEKRIGMAFSAPGGSMALPWKTISYSETKEGIDAILGLIAEREIGCIVVGMPRSLSGNLGPQAAKVQEFVDVLVHSTQVPIRLQDERFSTVAVERTMREAGTRRKKREERRDAEAAAYILQGYLDSHPSPLPGDAPNFKS